MPTEPFQCPDGNEFCATQIDSLCVDCHSRRERKIAKMDDEWRRQQRRKNGRRMTAGARFGEELANMAKALERSER